MPPAPNNSEDVAKRYGLEAIPESVRRLTQLVTRQDANLDDIAHVIAADRELTARLLASANPRAESEADYTFTTVEEALARSGVGCAMLLAMGEPLSRAVLKTFHTMLGIPLQSRRISAMEAFTSMHVLGEVSFSGRATGMVHLRLPSATARLAAERFLGMAPGELTDDSGVDDAIGELANIVVGNFKSNLCDAGLECKLSPPKISRTTEFKLNTAGGLAERLGFRAKDMDLFVDIRVNPWDD